MVEEESENEDNNEESNILVADFGSYVPDNEESIHENIGSLLNSEESTVENQPVSNPNSEDPFSVSQSYSQHYRSDMNKKLQVHGKKYKVGDEILIAHDFDNNTATRKRPFQGFFREDVFVVKEVTSEGQVLVENAEKNEQEWVSASRIKKIKK